MAMDLLDLTSTTTLPPPFNTTTSPLIPDVPPAGRCNYYVKNKTVVVFDFSNQVSDDGRCSMYSTCNISFQYGGIPQNLVFNLIGWSLLVFLFALLRRSAGNYGRLALVRKDDDDSKWTQLFFAPDEVNPEVRACVIVREKR